MANLTPPQACGVTAARMSGWQWPPLPLLLQSQALSRLPTRCALLLRLRRVVAAAALAEAAAADDPLCYATARTAAALLLPAAPLAPAKQLQSTLSRLRTPLRLAKHSKLTQ